MNNMDEEETEGEMGSLGVTYSLQDQGKRLITPVSTRFVYLIHFFRYLMDNKHAIEYLYATMSGIHDNIWARRPFLVNLEFSQMIVTSMQRIVDIILLTH